MTETYAQRLRGEYQIAKKELHQQTIYPHTPPEFKKAINTTLALCTQHQTEITLTELEDAFRVGYILESEILSRKVPVYIGVDFSRLSKANLNKITKSTIGHIGSYNQELADTLNFEYSKLLRNNEIINELQEKGFTKHIETQLTKAGLKRDTIDLIRAQTSANKMVMILENQGMRGGMHPFNVAKELEPHIRAIFGEKGVMIDNVGKLRKQFVINADGVHSWQNVVNTRPYYSTTRNYSDTVSRSSMLRAQRAARVETLEATNLVETYIWVATMAANMCVSCAMMHGQIIEDPNSYLGGLHPRCACEIRAIWTKVSGLTNRSPLYYENKRDEWFWKTHQTKVYNANVDKDLRIPNYNFLPKDALGEIPGKEEMRAIRTAMLR